MSPKDSLYQQLRSHLAYPHTEPGHAKTLGHDPDPGRGATRCPESNGSGQECYGE